MSRLRDLRKDKFIYLVIAALAIFGILFYANQKSKQSMPLATHGVMHAEKWDFAKQGALLLQGQWASYPSQLLSPSQITSNVNKSSFVTIPGPSPVAAGNRGKNSFGYVTYHLTIRVNPGDAQMGLLIGNVESSRRIFINGKLVLQSGTPAISSATYAPGDKPQVVFVHPKKGVINLVVQAANFDFYKTGIVTPIVLGTSEQIQRVTFFNSGMDFSAASIIGLFGVYYLSVFFILWRKRFRRYYDLLLMGLFFFVFSLQVPFEGAQIVFKVFPSLPYEVYWKLKILLPSIVILLIIQYMRYVLYPFKYRHIFTLFAVIFLGYGVGAIVLPMALMAKAIVIHSLMAIGTMTDIAIFVTVAIAYVRERFGTFHKTEIQLYMLASISMIVIVVSNALYTTAIVNNNLMTDITRVVFVGLISGLLAFRYYHAFSQMEALTEKLKKADRLKDNFLIQTAHELKTPLHVIINIIQSVIEKMKFTAREGESQLQSQELDLVQMTARRMSTTVNDIMDLARIRDGRLAVKITDVDVESCFSLIADCFSYSINEKKVQLAHQVHPGAELVRADENRLFQVLSNLVHNSIKHTERGLILLTSEKRGSYVYVSVEDTGTGISESQQGRLFIPYEQREVDDVSEETGIGVGLFISRELVNVMGGELYLDWSTADEGSRFVCKFPAAQSENDILVPFSKADIERNGVQVSDVQEDAGDAIGKPTILAVDDEVLNLKVLSSLFGGPDYNVITAASGHAALSSITQEKPDIILLDVMLPDMSGYEVCRTIRDTYSMIDLPVLFLTVRNTSEDMELAFSAGGNDFVAKPFEAKEIRARVETLLTMKSLSQAVVKNEIAFLQAQIKPHFLYNALNTISALCDSNPDRARDVTDELALYLRSRFDFGNLDKLVPLRQELENIYAYINVEKARFGERLEVQYDIADGVDLWIPPLILQPLVENAVKHGLKSRREGCQVAITVQVEETKTVIEVSDNGVGMSGVKIQEVLNTKVGRGVGLRNVNERLKKLFGHGLSITSGPGEGTKVVVAIPRSSVK